MKTDCNACYEACFEYDPKGGGCSYLSTGFNAAERVKPGQRCLHPEFSQEQVQETDLVTLCNLLAGFDAADED
jgi:hypothetical protein